MTDILKSSKYALMITSLNRYSLIALSISVWLYKGFWEAFLIFVGTRLAQYVLNFGSSFVFINMKKDLLENPIESELQRSWLMVTAELLVLAIAIYAAKFWL